MKRRPSIFFDRDGTIIEEVNYLSRPEQIRLIEGVCESLIQLRNMGFLLILITNQSGIARGYYDITQLNKIHDHLQVMLSANGVKMDGIYYCPHHVDGVLEQFCVSCDCRKPAPGMLFKAAEDLNISLSESWTVGDKMSDIQAGNNAGTRTVLVGTGYGKSERKRSSMYEFYIESISELPNLLQSKM